MLFWPSSKSPCILSVFKFFLNIKFVNELLLVPFLTVAALKPLKTFKLKPLFMKGSKTNLSNYRPILLLHLISKIVERIIYKGTSWFLTNGSTLCNNQSGFWKSHLTHSCPTFLHINILKHFREGIITGMILIDLQKAFDTTDHKISVKDHWIREH